MLEMRHITKEFPGVVALSDVSMTLMSGEVHGIVGENGAGKSTLMKILNGVYTVSKGNIFIDGKEVKPKSTKDAQNHGINIIFQEFSLIPHLNVIENIFLGRELLSKFGILDSKRMKEHALSTLKTINVDIPLDIPVVHLSVAEQQFIEIAKALAFNCKYLVLDEPTATLTPKEVEKLFSVMIDLKKKNVGFFYISHHLDEIFKITDRITCLRDGRFVASYKTKDINEERLISDMVGRSIEHSYPPKRKDNFLENKINLDVRKLTFEDGTTTSFQLYDKEIVGIAGLVGAGRTELCKALIGAYPCKEKEVYLNGELVKLDHPADALKKGIGYLSEDRKKDGLFLGFSIHDNVMISSLGQFLNRFHFILNPKGKEKTVSYIEQLNIRTPSVDKAVGELSGGNQQKVIIARWLLTGSKILIFDEPTRGIDVGAKAEIYSMLQKLADRGMSIIMISSDLPEIIGVSDRVLVVRRNEVVATLTGSDIDPEVIMQYASGGE